MSGERRAGAAAFGVATDSPLISVELLLFGTWGILVPYLGRPAGFVVDTRPINEVVDHVIPGIVVVAVAASYLVLRRRTFAGSLAVVAAGIWMTATHIPLLKQAADGQASMQAALWHSIPGMVILALGVIAGVVDAVTANAEASDRGSPPPSPPAETGD